MILRINIMMDMQNLRLLMILRTKKVILKGQDHNKTMDFKQNIEEERAGTFPISFGKVH